MEELNKRAQLGGLVPGNNEVVALEQPVPVVARLALAVVRVGVGAVGRVAPVLELLLVVLQRHQRREQAVARAAAANRMSVDKYKIHNTTFSIPQVREISQNKDFAC